MYVVYRDANVLKLRSKGALLLVAIGLVSLLLTPLWLPKIAETNTLTCERLPGAPPSCTLERSLFGLRVNQEEINGLQGAYVEHSTDDEGDILYRVILRTQQGNVPLSRSHGSNYERQATAVGQINAFVTDATTTDLSMRLNSGAGWLLGVVLIALDVGITVFGVIATTTTWVFDRRTRLITKTRWAFAGPKIWEYPMQDITAVTAAPSQDSEGSTTYRVELKTQGDRSIPLTPWYSSGYRSKEQTARLIRDFLELD